MNFAFEFGQKKYAEIKKQKLENQDFQSCDDIKEFCRSLPNEWTVLQVCKEHDNATTTSAYKDQMKKAKPIYLSLLKHARSSEFPDPICLRLDAPANQMSKFSYILWSLRPFILIEAIALNLKN